MLDANLTLADIYWRDDEFAPPVNGNAPEAAAALRGQFSLARADRDGNVVLLRDRYGINKLFYAIRVDGTVVVSNYIVDLAERGVPFEAIFSVPSGHATLVDTRARTLRNVAYHAVANRKPPDPGLPAIAGRIRDSLELWFGRLAARFADREVCLCLSGGLDSSLIAALARRHFPHVRGFTYSFVAPDHPESEDASYARRVADHLGLPLDFIPATKDDLLAALDDAIVYGQDWRDFNVHCAIVNELIGRHLAAHPAAEGRARLVLTGDMMNEIMADYTPITHAGKEYYTLPDIDVDQLRVILIRGLDAGDREIGVFARHGLDAVQPYGLVLENYLEITGDHLRGDAPKQQLMREVGGDLLPDFVLGRKKVRAQIGTSRNPTGILPLLVDSGRDSDWLRNAWCKRFDIADGRVLDRFVRMGRYRAAPRYPHGEERDGYVCG